MKDCRRRNMFGYGGAADECMVRKTVSRATHCTYIPQYCSEMLSLGHSWGGGGGGAIYSPPQPPGSYAYDMVTRLKAR